MICLLYDSALRSVMDAFTSSHPGLLIPRIPYPDTASQPLLMAITIPAGPTFEYFYSLASFENKALPLNVTGGSYGQARGNFSRFITRLNPRCFLPDLRAQICNHNYFGG